MSLFATLVARAQGEAATARPRRRSLFELVDADPYATDEAVDDREGTPAPAERFTQPHTAAVLADAHRPQPISSVDSLLTPSPAPPPRAVNDSVVQPLSVADHRISSNDPTLPRTRNEPGPPPALHEHSAGKLDRRGDRTEASPASPPAADPSFPLATELPTPTVAGHDSGRDDQASMHHDSQPTPLVEVHIGTIEVVAKAPAAPRAAPRPRPPAARVSLDDYRRQAL